MTCDQLAANCGFVQAGCNVVVDCGGCTDPETCGGGGLDHVCGCTPRTTSQVCTLAASDCGHITADDGCGTSRDFDCGSCAAGAMCMSNTCCTPPTDPQMCSSAGFACGHTLIIDACGQARSVDCGACGGTSTCTMSDTGSACGACVPETDEAFCQRLGATCGMLSANDNCGAPRAVMSCGGCDAGVTCGEGGVANLCECLPLLGYCAANAQCCNGNCGDGGLCCQPLGASCIDDSDCCIGSCAQSVCVPYADGGIRGNGLSDDGGTL
jgi:hypothetical protein